MWINENKIQRKYQWKVIQSGQIIITPDGRIPPFRDHRPTSVVIWPEDSHPDHHNTILTDPFFSKRSFSDTLANLKEIDLPLPDIGWIYITHPHGDHQLFIPQREYKKNYPVFHRNASTVLSDIIQVSLPGHHPDQKALVFRSFENKITWIVGDAILDEEWLRAWAYYFPNHYSKDDIILTWKSVVKVLFNAEVIIPGHGLPIHVTDRLIGDLLLSFPKAEYAHEIPQITDYLTRKLSLLKRKQ